MDRSIITPWEHEQNRVADNLAQHYEAWIQAARGRGVGHLQWKRVKDRDYLYRIIDGHGNGSSLGVRTEETEALYADHREARTTERRLWMTLGRDAGLYRALRMPRITPYAADVARALDLAGWLDGGVLVVGTTAMAAYEVASASSFASGLDATEDFDMTWAGSPPGKGQLLDVLKRADATYTVNQERTFQVRSAAGYEVELLLPKGLRNTYPVDAPIRPVPMAEQDWLMLGTPVSAVVLGTHQKPARLCVPDPRFFALQKLWMSEKPARRATKKSKDREQGLRVLQAVSERLPHYPLDAAFARRLPAELRDVWNTWKESLLQKSSPRRLKA